MEKDHQPDSMATVAMKPDYPPSEGYSSSEPPPAYRQPRSTAVQVARIVAFTVILSSMVLGGFLLAASYVQARAGCQQLEQLDAMLEKELAYEARMQAEDQLQLSRMPALPLALRQDAPAVDLKKDDALLAEEPSVHAKNEENLQSIDDHQDSDSDESSESDSSSDSSSDSGSSSESADSSDESSGEMGRIPIRITLPLQLDFDELAGALIEKNQRSRMNCVVEKRKNEELVDHQARSLQLPFGLNLTTEPRLQRVTGERMAIFCESGDDSNRDMPEAVEVLSGFPVPLGGPVRLPLNFPIHQAAFRPPMPAQHMQAPAPQAPQDYQNQQQEMPQRPFPPQFVARHLPQFGPQPPQQLHFQIREQQMPQAQPQHIPFQIREQQMPQPQSQHMPFQIREQMPQHNPFQMREQEPQQQRVHFQVREEMPRPQGMFQMREQVAQEQQIPFEILQRIREITQSQGPAQEREQQVPVQFQEREQMPQEQTRQMPFQMREQNPQEQEVQMSRIPMQMALVPREVRIHVQRIQLPQVDSDQVPQDTHVSQEEQSEMEPMAHPLMSAADLQAVQQAVRAAVEDQEKEQRAHDAAQQADESREARNSMMERQAMARALPVNIPVPMMVQEAKDQEARPVVQDPERPHYVQPRSVRSARSVNAHNNPLHREKRVKRCTCDCNC